MRLIDADNASARLEEYAGICRRGGIREQAKDLQGFANVLNNPRIFRTVDAVPVVRCKDCKHRGSSYKCPMRKLVMPFSGPGAFEDCTEDDGYCHMGERMDGGASDEV